MRKTDKKYMRKWRREQDLAHGPKGLLRTLRTIFRRKKK